MRLALAVLASVLLSVGVGAPARSAVIGVPVTLVGRGWGHGIGMSQYGAYGAARQGLTSAQILAFYYPGTVWSADLGNPTVRVLLSGTAGTQVRPAAGLTLDTGGCSELLPASTDTSSWLVERSGAGWVLLRVTPTGGRVSYPSSCPVSSAQIVSFRTTALAQTSLVSVVTATGGRKAYRGWIQARWDGSSQRTINLVHMDDYLASVVPSEMPASWHPEALAVQAVAARSYAARAIGSGVTSDLCDTTTCQVYSGATTENPASTAAVQATSGVVLRYRGAIALTMYASYHGGQLADGGLPYLVAKPDPYEAGLSPAQDDWTVTVGASTLSTLWPSIGTYESMTFVRDGAGLWGGRATQVLITGALGSVQVSGTAFAAALGLRSRYVATTARPPGEDLLGNSRADLATVSTTGLWHIYPTNGRGGWLPRRAVTGIAATAVISPGDVTGDRVPDLWARTPSGALYLHAGRPDGGLAPAVRVGGGFATYTNLTSAGDMTGDGFPDLFGVDSSGTAWIYRGNGAGGWLGGMRVGSAWGDLRAVTAFADVDKDGGTDLVGVTRSTGDLYLLSFDRVGGYRGARIFGRGWSGMSLLIGPGDFDGEDDGQADLLARDANGRLILYSRTASNTWRAGVTVGAGWNGIALAAS